MEFDQVQGRFDNLEYVCYFQNCRLFPTWLSYALYMYMSRGGGGGGWWSGYSEEFWRGCAARVVATIPFAMETESQNHTLGNGKWVKIKPLTIGNVTKLTTFEAILHAIGQIWPKSCHSLRKNGGIRSKFAENISLATEARPKLDPWLQKSSQKYGYGSWAQKGTLAGSTPQ